MVIYPFRRHPLKFIRLQCRFSTVLWGTQCWTGYPDLKSLERNHCSHFHQWNLHIDMRFNKSHLHYGSSQKISPDSKDAEIPQASSLFAPKHLTTEDDFGTSFRICYKPTSFAMETSCMVLFNSVVNLDFEWPRVEISLNNMVWIHIWLFLC